MKLYLYNYVEIISAIVCTFYFFYKPSVTNRWFVALLWITVLVEFTGKLLVAYPAKKMAVYNIWVVVEGAWFLCFIPTYSFIKQRAQTYYLFSGILLVFAIGNGLFFQPITIYNHYTAVLSDVLVIIACLLAYWEYLVSSINKTFPVPAFLIISALLIYAGGNFIVDGTFNFLSKVNPDYLLVFYKMTNWYLNVLMYSCFAIAFVVEGATAKK